MPTDSTYVHADSLASILTTPVKWDADTIIDTDLDAALAAAYSTAGIDTTQLCSAVPPPPPTWHDGIEGQTRPITVGNNSGVLAIITGVFVLMMLSYRKCSRLFATLFKELLGMRQRSNVFDEHTSNETGVLTLMAFQWCVYTGLLLYTLLTYLHEIPQDKAFIDTVILIGICTGYYVFQFGAYNLVGYTFSNSEGRKYLVEGFTSSQSLLGFTLIIPSLVAIFYPNATEAMLLTGMTLYLIARIIFIVKGFRIFYHKISSLIYFILYLCTLEIIPLIVLYNLALLTVNSD